MPERNKSTQKVLIVYTTAGSGHKAATQSLETAWRKLYPDDEVIVEDILSYTSRIFRFIYSSGYMLLASKLPILWRMSYYKDENIASFKPPGKFGWFIKRLVLNKFVRKMNKLKPDIIVSTHFLPSDGVVMLKRQNKFNFKFAVIITDYGLHSYWLAPHVDRYFVATPYMKAELLSRNDYLKLDDDQIVASGIPINPKYTDIAQKSSLREKFNLDPDQFTMLLFRNVFSDKNFETFINSLITVPHPVQLLLIAGKYWPISDRIKKKLVENNISYRIFGYIDFMEELMALSDMVISKSGGLTTSECMAAGTPMAIYRPYAGQEERNAEYILEQGAGFMVTQLAGIAYRITELIEDQEKLRKMKENTVRISRPQAAYTIVEELKKMGE